MSDTSTLLAAKPLAETIEGSVGLLWLRILLATLSGFLLFVPWLNTSLYWVGWVAWVPLLFALRGTRPLQALLLGWIAGTLCFAGGSYWLADFIVNLKDVSQPIGIFLSLLFWIYLGLLIGLGGMIYRWIDCRLNGYEVLSFPVTMVCVMGLYPMLFKTHFADGQVEFLPALQAVDLTGAAGLDAMMMLFSVLLYRLLSPTAKLRPKKGINGSRTAWVLVLVWLVYGYISLHVWDQRIQGGETRQFGLVQPNDPVTLNVPEPAVGFSREYPEEMDSTKRLVRAGAEWVVWPEARYKGYFDHYSVRSRYAKEVAELGVPLIFHDVERRWEDSRQLSFNTVSLLNAEGEHTARYRKMLRMPFGEYLPTPWTWPGLKWLVEGVFGEFLRPLGAGQKHAEFELNGLRLVPKVCYEAAFPEFVASAVGADGAGKLLLFLSQDNWFGETSQPLQHANMSILRAVENRLPMVHLINNGPSIVATANGRVITRTNAFSRAEALVTMPFDEHAGGSWYSRHPQAFPRFMQGLLVLLLGLSWWRGRHADR